MILWFIFSEVAHPLMCAEYKTLDAASEGSWLVFLNALVDSSIKSFRFPETAKLHNRSVRWMLTVLSHVVNTQTTT